MAFTFFNSAKLKPTEVTRIVNAVIIKIKAHRINEVVQRSEMVFPITGTGSGSFESAHQHEHPGLSRIYLAIGTTVSDLERYSQSISKVVDEKMVIKNLQQLLEKLRKAIGTVQKHELTHHDVVAEFSMMVHKLMLNDLPNFRCNGLLNLFLCAVRTQWS